MTAKQPKLSAQQPMHRLRFLTATSNHRRNHGKTCAAAWAAAATTHTTQTARQLVARCLAAINQRNPPGYHRAYQK